jgi:MFS family permease
MFGFGAVSVILALYLSSLGFDTVRIGWLLSLALASDLLISFLMTTNADRLGRRRMLALSAVLMFAAGLIFALSGNYWLLLAAAIIGVISPSGNEIGPFLALEQASLAELAPSKRRTQIFAWYNLAGSAATAAGALAGGLLVQEALARGSRPPGRLPGQGAWG